MNVQSVLSKVLLSGYAVEMNGMYSNMANRL